MASLDALPSVVAAVRGRVPVLFDSGVRGGADVATALALGARAVLLGRPYVYGLALAGTRVEYGVRGPANGHIHPQGPVTRRIASRSKDLGGVNDGRVRRGVAAGAGRCGGPTGARDEASQAENPDRRNPIEELVARTDWAPEGWRRSRADAAQARAERAAREAERAAEANKPPPF